MKTRHAILVAGILLMAAAAGGAVAADSPGSAEVGLERQRRMEVLAERYPFFGNALQAMDEDRLEDAVQLLEPLSQQADSVLRAQAGLILARLHVNADRYHQARELLESLQDASVDLLDQGEAIFMLGVVQARLLERQEARKTLARFLEKHPQAPERLRVSAGIRLRELAEIQEGSLRDVADRMDFCRHRLAQALTDEPTRQAQKTIVDLLDKLIKDAQDKEAGGMGSGGGENSQDGQAGSPAGAANPSAPAQQSVAPVGEARMGALSGPRFSAAEDWMKLQARDRERVLDTLKTQFPDRYRALVEQYYRSLSEETSP